MAEKTKAVMPKFERAPQEVIDLFTKLTSSQPELELRKMFGYPCAFINGNMVCGVFADRIMLRLSDQDRAAFGNIPGARNFEPFPGRPMREYVEFPKEMMKDLPKLVEWLQVSFDYAKSLPVKEKKPRKG